MTKKLIEEKTWDKKIMDECEILYCQHSKSMAETCMCWGFSCGEGWKKPLTRLSYTLEILNRNYYPKYNIRIQADQVKEKFGTLRFYYSIITDPPKFIRGIISFINIFVMLLNKINFNDKAVSNNSFKFKKSKFLYDVELYLQSIIIRLHNTFMSYSRTSLFISRYLDIISEKLIDEAEDECYDTCEECGNPIGKNSCYKKCSTVGWITYICNKCAEKNGRKYIMDSKMYEGDQCIMTEDEVKNDKKYRKVLPI